ncbi:MAG: hypothetical protein HC906_02795 [Bacteroidales bacterium]|nr:hypothetical protein [Bacteroidales bacterium]
MAFKDETIYAATDKGVYKADINSPNLVDYNFWTKLSFLPAENVSYKSIVYFGGKVLTVKHSLIDPLKIRFWNLVKVDTPPGVFLMLRIT